jgi:hypothetical protein
MFVVGDEGLQNADLFGELNLGETAFVAEAGKTLPDGFVTVIERRQIQTRRTGHEPHGITRCFWRENVLSKSLTRFLTGFREAFFSRSAVGFAAVEDAGDVDGVLGGLVEEEAVVTAAETEVRAAV